MRNGAGEARLKFIKPLESALVLEPPVSDDWLHEIKFDGFRVQLVLDWAGARAFTKNGHDWSKRFWPVVDDGASYDLRIIANCCPCAGDGFARAANRPTRTIFLAAVG
ncbi:hypothetical protein AJ88_27705 [Mesorhizobium amorphae CCBAU 01583]|nr:hypothetical protein AJ88_27705 [Mesorhizobium amorphae CCBAU 01583]